jgi:hypothetical protein
MTTLVRTAVMVLALSAIAIPGAQARNVEVFRSGPCTGASHWSLELDRETRIEADWEVHSVRAGQTWRVVMRHNGSVVWSGTRTTEHDGDFEVERSVTDASGADAIRVRAVNNRTGEVCRGGASI